ncbi:hypothetical protein ABZ208_33995 [Streptomyces sp. NPDC006208]|uniref:hypothetical protein n=1 Tax=Streptomyces sp. NPDC006208 TaxID=3156734 RepID=UPI0033BA6F4B
MLSPAPARQGVGVLLLCCALLATLAGCRSDQGKVSGATPVGTASAEEQKHAKARFAANAGLAAGATYQWIVKPYREGRFKDGADGRTTALFKAGLAGAFTYNRLKAATGYAKGDPLLSEAVAPITMRMEELKKLGSKLRTGRVREADIRSFEKAVTSFKHAGKGAGVEITQKTPSASQLAGSQPDNGGR